MKTISVDDFIHSILDSQSRVALFLGAGASVSSGIPSSADLIGEWQEGLFRRACAQDYKGNFTQWKQRFQTKYKTWLKGHHPKDTPESKLYGYTFEQVARTRSQRQQRIADLCDVSSPKSGYYALASLLHSEVFDTILTTNFDDLVAEACFDLGIVRPQVSAHTETARLVRLGTTRPKIIKLHGDFLFDDLSNTDFETTRLRKGMDDILRQVNQEFGLLFIGYGGNDNSIMTVLEDLAVGNPQGLFWCALDGQTPNARVQRLLDDHSDSYLVPIAGFDELMAQIFRSLAVDLTALDERRRDRDSNVRSCLALLKGTHPVGAAVAEADQRLSNLQLLRQANTIANAGRFDEARLAATGVLKIDPRNALASSLLSEVLFNMSDLQGAEDAIRQAMAVSPQARFMNQLVVILWLQGRLQEALTILDTVTEPQFLNSRAIILRDLDRPAEALEAINEYIGAAPAATTGLLNKASILLALGQIEDSEAIFRVLPDTFSKVPDSGANWLLRGVTYAGAHDEQAAINDFTSWARRRGVKVRRDAERFLTSLATHGHVSAKNVLARLRDDELI